MAAVSTFDPRHTQRMKGNNTEKGMKEERPTQGGSQSMNLHNADTNNAELWLRLDLFSLIRHQILIPSNPENVSGSSPR